MGEQILEVKLFKKERESNDDVKGYFHSKGHRLRKTHSSVVRMDRSQQMYIYEIEKVWKFIEKRKSVCF